MPTKRGENAITGPGVDTPEGFEADRSVVLQTQHSQMWGGRLASACEAFLVGAEADEAELAAELRAAEAAGGEAAGPLAFKAMLCEREGQACAAPAA